MDNEIERLSYSVDEATQATSLGRSNLYELMDCGEIPYCKVGRRRLILKEDLRNYLLAHRRTVRSPD